MLRQTFQGFASLPFEYSLRSGARADKSNVSSVPGRWGAPLLALCACLVSACGGGGGGGGAVVSPSFPLGSTPSSTPQDLTSLPQLTEIGVAISATASLRIGDGYYFDSWTTVPVPRIGLRTAAGDIVEVALSVPQLSVAQNFTTTLQQDPLDGNVVPGVIWTSGINTVSGRDVTVDIIDPAVSQLRYHTFGNWGYELSTPTAIVVGYVVLGTPTPVSSVPTTGTATYNGVMNAVYTAAGAGLDSFFDVTAAATATANFATRNIAFSTSGTVRQSVLNNAITADANLNLTGTLTYAVGSNQVSGALSSAGGLAGNAAGNFFGPNGQEIGGTFVLSRNPGTGTQEHMFGAFGLHQ